MTGPYLSDIDIRFLTIAAQIPGAAILAAGDAGVPWSAAARQIAPACRIESIDDSLLDDFASELARRAIRHVFLLRLEGAAVLRALSHAGPLLKYARIDLIQFGEIDVRATLPAIAGLLNSFGYRLYGVEPDGKNMTQLRSWIEGLRYGRFFAVQARVADLLVANERTGLDLAGLCQRHGIDITGLIHLGAHEGDEIGSYRAIGAFPVAFVEAHPDIYPRLVARLVGYENVSAIHAAITDRDGPVTLHLSSDDQSSSVLPLAEIERLIPTTVGSGTIEVPGRSLDSLFAELRADGNPVARANLLVSDIQGAELLALQGAEATLPQFDAIVLELNFDELYEGGAQVEEIDDFMSEHSFARVATISAWHPSWSDAFYVRQRG